MTYILGENTIQIGHLRIQETILRSNQITWGVFFVAARERNLLVGKIDLSDGSIKYWDEADTAATRTISVDKIKKHVPFSLLSRYICKDIN
ncbi:hypothetical protein [Sporosarcina limicola]|uniref:Tagatose-1,6-bisphosphate aldolase non-catalytic subunit AgaZ/GatZ n=1 Tax=Sporosarcina limicola TaxID=34101 RepID=A0A927R8H0_9BACL|nr:hypothetical protein [Sporosarcina limicola]MBE1556994.1 tagatose-1,6-bisphosphate aldolase non-catalytic subunit AgaZ/GatZ [Sporosarcina limicola]